MARAARVTGLAPQRRTTDLAASIGFSLAFAWDDFYAGLRAGDAEFHLKRVHHRDPSIAFVAAGDHVHLCFHVDDLDQRLGDFASPGVTPLSGPVVRPWGTREAVLRDDQGHTLYFSESNAREALA